MTRPPEPPHVVVVYREDPAWDDLGGARWFTMRVDVLERLRVVAYEVHDDGGTLDERHPAVVAIRAEHPGCVLVY